MSSCMTGKMEGANVFTEFDFSEFGFSKSGFSKNDGFTESVKGSKTMKPVCAILARTD